MTRKKSYRKIKQREGKAARKRIEDFHMREKERKNELNPIFRSLNYEVVTLPQPFASMTVLGLTKLMKRTDHSNFKNGEKVFIYAANSTDESNKRLKDDDILYSIYVNARHMGYLGKSHELPVDSYIGYVVIGDKTKNDYYMILDSFYFDKHVSEKPYSLSKCEPRKANVEYVKLEDNVIHVPLSDYLWNCLIYQEGRNYTHHNTAFFYWKPIFKYFYSNQYGFGNENGLYDIVFSNKGRKRRYSQNNCDAITKEVYKRPGKKELEVVVFHFDRITRIQEHEKSAFQLLQNKEWILDWNCVLFKNNYFIVVPPDNGSVSFKPINISYPGVIESFNYLKGYLNDRLAPVRCSVKNMNLTISDTITLEEVITKFASAAKQHAITTTETKLATKATSYLLPSKQVLSKSQQLTEEEFKKYKSKYIDFLTKHQDEKYKIIPCVERLAHTTGDMTEYAFMFSIQCNGDRVLIVHENVNPDRSTLLFVVKENAYDETIRLIYDFLQSAEINKRSGIRDGAIQISETGVINYRSVNHNDINSWQSIIEDNINNAMKMKKKEPNILKTTFPSLNRLLKETQTVEGFKAARFVYEELNLPLNRKIKISDILARVPKSNFFIDTNGKKLIAIPERRKKYVVNSKGEKIEVKDNQGNPVYEYKLSPILNNWTLEKLKKALTVTHRPCDKGEQI